MADLDPYDQPVKVAGRYPHMHSEPVCAYPECETYLTRDQMREMQQKEADHG